MCWFDNDVIVRNVCESWDDTIVEVIFLSFCVHHSAIWVWHKCYYVYHITRIMIQKYDWRNDWNVLWISEWRLTHRCFSNISLYDVDSKKHNPLSGYSHTSYLIRHIRISTRRHSVIPTIILIRRNSFDFFKYNRHIIAKVLK